jgi:hypothetical protein
VNAEPNACRRRRPGACHDHASRGARLVQQCRAAIARNTAGQASSGTRLLIAVLLAIFLGGCFSGKTRREDRAQAPPPVAELNSAVQTPPEPAGQSDADAFQESLAAVAGAGGAKAALLDDTAWLAAISPRPTWGDQRAGDPANLWRNWELHFSRGTAKEKYARELDFFGIELAVVQPGNKLLYVSSFSRKKVQTRVGPADQEKRCYLTWREGDLSRADAELLSRAGISSEDHVVLKILPPKVEAALVALERASAGGSLDGVRKTRFGIRPAGDGYEFYVMEQFRKEQPAP